MGLEVITRRALIGSAAATATAADLAAKLAFMVERQMGDGVDWLPELLADARRVASANRA